MADPKNQSQTSAGLKPEDLRPGKDAQVLGGPAPQGDNPQDKGTAQGVVPATVQDVEPVPNPGPDHEAVLRAAKYAGAQGAFGKPEEELEEIGQKVKRARALIDQRNKTTDGGRIEEIDAELEALGFCSPVATTEAQRHGLEPLDRHAPASQKA